MSRKTPNSDTLLSALVGTSQPGPDAEDQQSEQTSSTGKTTQASSGKPASPARQKQTQGKKSNASAAAAKQQQQPEADTVAPLEGSAWEMPLEQQLRSTLAAYRKATERADKTAEMATRASTDGHGADETAAWIRRRCEALNAPQAVRDLLLACISDH